MRRLLLFSVFFLSVLSLVAQTNSYTIAFENAVHHEANVTVNFPNVSTDTLEVRMSRSSPGRYALHEFAKNVYSFKATDENNKPLKVGSRRLKLEGSNTVTPFIRQYLFGT